jgi:hypothetical protein
MSGKQKINIIKVPNPAKFENEIKKELPRMPRMYLELIENKDKIKPNLVNREYDPDEVSTVVSESNFYQRQEVEEDNIIQKNLESTLESTRMFRNVAKNEKSETSSMESEDNIELSDNQEEDGEDNEEVEEDVEENEMEEEDEVEEDFSEEDENENVNQEGEEEKNSIYESEDGNENGNNYYEKSQIPMETNHPIMISQSQNINEVSMISQSAHIHANANQNIHPIKNNTKEKLKEILKNPPRLSDLEKDGYVRTKKVIPNLDVPVVEEEDELKRELLYKFDLLKRSYKNVEIPEFTIHSDYKNMNKTYENTLRRVSLDTNVENYKNYMIAGFMLIEYILSSWFKFDMSGFTQQQIINMNQYERLLIELGEKSYVPTDKQWPVELRLLGMVLLNAVIFIVARIIIKKTGTNLFGMINSTKQEFQQPVKKRKMKGPSLDLNAIPDIDASSVTHMESSL